MITDAPAISMRTSLQFEECLGLLRHKLHRDEFRVVAQIRFDREFKNTLGLESRKCTVLVVWNAFYAYQALLCEASGELFLPFNISVSDEDGSILITTRNHSSAGCSQGPIGVQILARELNRRVEQILMELAVYNTAGSGSVTLPGTKEAV